MRQGVVANGSIILRLALVRAIALCREEPIMVQEEQRGKIAEPDTANRENLLASAIANDEGSQSEPKG